MIPTLLLRPQLVTLSRILESAETEITHPSTLAVLTILIRLLRPILLTTHGALPPPLPSGRAAIGVAAVRIAAGRIAVVGIAAVGRAVPVAAGRIAVPVAAGRIAVPVAAGRIAGPVAAGRIADEEIKV